SGRPAPPAACLLIATARLAQPVGKLLAGVLDRAAEVVEGFAEARRVVSDRVARLGARMQRLVAGDELAAHDAVVVAGLDPLHQLVNSLYRHRVGEVEIDQQARE